MKLFANKVFYSLSDSSLIPGIFELFQIGEFEMIGKSPHGKDLLVTRPTEPSLRNETKFTELELHTGAFISSKQLHKLVQMFASTKKMKLNYAKMSCDHSSVA